MQWLGILRNYTGEKTSRYDIIKGIPSEIESESKITIPEDAWHLSFPGIENRVWFIPTCIDNHNNQRIVEFFLRPEHFELIKSVDLQNVDWIVRIRESKFHFRPKYILVQELSYFGAIRIKFGIPNEIHADI
jgi:hypothetical protein